MLMAMYEYEYKSGSMIYVSLPLNRPCPAKTPGLNPPLAVSHGGFSKAKYMLTRVSWDLKLTMAISKIGI